VIGEFRRVEKVQVEKGGRRSKSDAMSKLVNMDWWVLPLDSGKIGS